MSKQGYWALKLQIVTVSPVIITVPFALVISAIWDAGSPMPSTLTSSEAQNAHFSGEDQDLGV